MAKRSRKQGVARATTAAFTLVEVVVTVLLVAIVLVGVMEGIRALGAADAKARDADLLQRLAARKWEELGTVDDPATAEDRGDFDDAGHPEIEWTLTVQPSAVENIDTVTVTARRASDNVEQSMTGMVFVRPVAGGATDSGNTGNTGGAATTP